MSWWHRLFGREKKTKGQESPTTASPAQEDSFDKEIAEIFERFRRDEKTKGQESPTTASPATATARPSGAQKDAAVESQLKIVYARVEELGSRIPRDTDWNEALGNFAQNLYAARRDLTDGRDMRGNPISRSDIAAGLRRMCDSYSGATSLSILGGIHGSSIRKEFEEILERTLAIANTIGDG